MEISKDHQTVMPYLMLEGAEKFIEFTKTVFDAELLNTHAQPDGTGIRHAEVRIGGSTIMFTDCTDKWPRQTANMFVYVENADETFKLALQNGATEIMPPADQDYGRSCGVKDTTENTWWITSVLKK